MKYLFSTVWAAVMAFVVILDYSTGRDKVYLSAATLGDVSCFCFLLTIPMIFIADQLRIMNRK